MKSPWKDAPVIDRALCRAQPANTANKRKGRSQIFISASIFAEIRKVFKFRPAVFLVYRGLCTLTIQPMPNLSVSIPKHGDQNVLVSGIITDPPAESALNARLASSSVGTDNARRKPSNFAPSSQPSEAITVVSPTRNVVCITLFSKPGGTMPGGGFSGLSL